MAQITPAQMELAERQSNRWQQGDPSSASDGMSAILDNMYYTSLQNRLGTAAAAPQLRNDSGPSNSEMFRNSAPLTRDISKEGMTMLSQSRQEYLKEINERTAYGSRRPDLGITSGQYSSFDKRTAEFRRNASSGGSTAGLSGGGALNPSSNTTHIAPEIYSPLFLTQNLQLPRDRITANAWNRAYYDVHPIVSNSINLHATYPISKLNIKCEDKEVEKFFEDMANKVDLQTVVQNVALEFWKLGEAFPYASFDESTGTWDKIFLHNPDYITVKAYPIPTRDPAIYLRPDPELQKIVHSSDPEHIKIREQLDPQIVHHVFASEFIPLDNFNISHLKNLASPYDVRGTSIIVSAWKDLMLYDKLRESKFVQADGMVNPITLVKIGADGPEGFYPRQDEIENWRQIFEQAQYNRDFKIFTHNAVNVERVGFNGQVLDTSADFQMIMDNIFMGLMVPKSILTQEGASYASASVALDVMRQRYNGFRTMLSNWLEQKIFAPISEVQGFYSLDNGKKRLIVPQVEWNHMTLYDLDNYIAHITTLVERRKVSTRTLDRSLGLNRENEITNMRAEMIEEAKMLKEREALAKMNLAQLSSLNPEEQIVDPESAPGAAAPTGMPGVPGAPGGMGGPMDMMGSGMGGGMPMPPPGGLGGGLGGGFGPPPGDLGGGLPGGPPGAPPAPPL